MRIVLLLPAFACLVCTSCKNERQAYQPQAKPDTVIARSTTSPSPKDAITISNLPGQDETNPLSPERIWTEAYDLVEEMPQFPGGNEALRNYLATELRYPQSAAEKGIEGKVIVRFIVLSDGHIGPVRVDDSALQADPELEKEAVRLIAEMPRWTPGRHHGKEMAVKCVIPVEFKQSKKDTTRYYIPECFLVDVQDLFEEREDTSIVMWAEHPVYGTDVQAVNVFVENPTHTSLTYGRDWYLYQWNGKEWVLAKIKGPDIAWQSDGFDNNRAPVWYCFRFPIANYYHLSKGKYRICKSFYAGRQEIALHAEFEIK